MEKEKERNINVWLPFDHPLLGTWPAAQACALTGNRTSNPLVRRPAFNPLSYTNRGCLFIYLFFEEAVDSHGLIIHKNIKSYKMMFPSYSSSHSAQRCPFSIDSYY